MRSYPFGKARSEFSRLFDRALAGEPQRVTRRGKGAVVILSEADWLLRRNRPPTLADLFLRTVGQCGPAGTVGRRSWARDQRRLGADFAD